MEGCMDRCVVVNVQVDMHSTMVHGGDARVLCGTPAPAHLPSSMGQVTQLESEQMPTRTSATIIR
jgi:hypothetical protein